MHFIKSILGVFAISLILISCSNDSDSNPSSNNNDIGQAADGEGVYSISGDVEMTGSGSATHVYQSAYTINGVTFAIHEVAIEDLDNNSTIIVEFYVLDSEADMFSGKEPETGTYKIYNPGLSTPQDDYVKVSANINNYEHNFSTDEESQIELTTHDNGIWEAELVNVLDDYETDEVVTLECNFKANPLD